MAIFSTVPGAIQYQAFEATFMACDASHLNHQIHLNLNHLTGQTEYDSTEFVAEEDLQSAYNKSDEGDGDREWNFVLNDDTTIKTSNTTSSK